MFNAYKNRECGTCSEALEKYNRFNHINPVIPGWRIDMHAMNIQNIWRML